MQIARQLLQARIDVQKSLGVGRRVEGDFCGGSLRVSPPIEYPAAIDHRGENRIARGHTQTMSRKVQIPDHLGHQHAGYIGGERHPVPRDHLFGDAGPANNAAPFYDQHFLTRLGQIGGCCQSVMTGADDDGVEAGLGGLCADHLMVPHYLCATRLA